MRNVLVEHLRRDEEATKRLMTKAMWSSGYTLAALIMILFVLAVVLLTPMTR